MLVPIVAIDSDALKRDSSRQVDMDAVSRLFPRSSWKHRKMKDVMGILDDDMTQSRKALGGLDLRSLVRVIRDHLDACQAAVTDEHDLSAAAPRLEGRQVRELSRVFLSQLLTPDPTRSIATKSKKYPSISIGFASAPVSFEEQIERTPEQTVPEWFGT